MPTHRREVPIPTNAAVRLVLCGVFLGKAVRGSKDARRPERVQSESLDSMCPNISAEC
jgi:hypothetical protein